MAIVVATALPALENPAHVPSQSTNRNRHHVRSSGGHRIDRDPSVQREAINPRPLAFDSAFLNHSNPPSNSFGARQQSNIGKKGLKNISILSHLFAFRFSSCDSRRNLLQSRCDDMISTGGTVIGTAEALLGAGARPEITIAATHGLLLDGAREKLSHEAVAPVVVTDTIRIGEELSLWPQLRIVSVAPLIGAAIQRFMEDGSITPLFRHGLEDGSIAQRKE